MKIFFIDIDGTLANDVKAIPEENLAAIKTAQANGHLVFINTGRASSRLPYSLAEIAQPDGIITSLGATIKIGGETVYTNYTTVDETVKIYETALPSGWHIYFDTEYKKYEINIPNERVDVALSEYDVLTKIPAGQTEHFEITGADYIREHGIMLSKLVAFPENMGFAEIEKLGEFFHINKCTNYYDLSLRSCGKDTAMRFICDKYGGDMSDTVAIGDSENDISMLSCAGIGAAVKNASPATKAKASFISEKTNNEAAVADIIYRFM